MVGWILIFAACITLGFGCDNNFVAVGDKCLFFASTMTLDHQSSSDICVALKGKLLQIDEPQQLRDLVEYIQSDVTLQTGYWIDGANIEGEWLYADGTNVPLGTPFWSTWYDNTTGFGQEPRPSQVDSCLALKPEAYYFFTSNDCEEEMSPLCEEVTGTLTSIGSSSSCGGALTAPSGIITSPNYPGPWPDSTSCIWTITSGQDSLISFTITDIDIAPNDAYYLSIRDGPDSNSPELGRYHDPNTATPISLITTGNQAWLNFNIPGHNSGNQHTGFSLTYTTVFLDGTENNIHYSSPTGNVNSPCYPIYYPFNLKYSWQITVEEGYYIVLTVVTFDTEVDSDIVQIRDGDSEDSPILAELSGSLEIGYQILSTTNEIFISFTSDDENYNKGFDFIWTEKKLCPTPYLNVGAMCLHIEINEMTFGMAGIACQESSGVLATINDPQDLRDLYVFLHDQGIADYDFWIGGNDNTLEGIWTWPDGSPVPIGTPFWGTLGAISDVQEPNGNDSENCLLLSAAGYHYFRDAACDTKAPGLCMHIA